MTLPAVGPVTALTRARNVGDVQRFSLDEESPQLLQFCVAQRRAPEAQFSRAPLSKQQCLLIEARKWLRETARI